MPTCKTCKRYYPEFDHVLNHDCRANLEADEEHEAREGLGGYMRMIREAMGDPESDDPTQVYAHRNRRREADLN